MERVRTLLLVVVATYATVMGLLMLPTGAFVGAHVLSAALLFLLIGAVAGFFLWWSGFLPDGEMPPDTTISGGDRRAVNSARLEAAFWFAVTTVAYFVVLAAFSYVLLWVLLSSIFLFDAAEFRVKGS